MDRMTLIRFMDHAVVVKIWDLLSARQYSSGI